MHLCTLYSGCLPGSECQILCFVTRNPVPIVYHTCPAFVVHSTVASRPYSIVDEAKKWRQLAIMGTPEDVSVGWNCIAAKAMLRRKLTQ